MHAVSQIIARNLGRLGAESSCLWINPEQDEGPTAVSARCTSLMLFCQDFGASRFHAQAGSGVEFGAFPAGDRGRYAWIILRLPRQKALLDMLLDCAASLLDERGRLWLAGENQAGIKSADRLLRRHFGEVRRLDSARHCGLYEARAPLGPRAFEPAAYRLQWRLDCGPSGIEVVSYPGVFAHGRLDAGTGLLLSTLAGRRLDGEVLDFACGAGLVGACIAATHPQARVTLLDNSALALRACEETLAANGLDAQVLASDGLAGLRGSFDWVVCNPPIHAGVRTDTRLGMRLLESVPGHIRPGGSLVMVANIHLPYENWLSRAFSHAEELAASGRYKVVLARK